MNCTNVSFLISIFYIVIEDVITGVNWAKDTRELPNILLNFLQVDDYFKIKSKKINISLSTICQQLIPIFSSHKKEPTYICLSCFSFIDSITHNLIEPPTDSFEFFSLRSLAMLWSLLSLLEGFDHVVNIHRTLS